jgi:hypothetical protein
MCAAIADWLIRVFSTCQCAFSLNIAICLYCLIGVKFGLGRVDIFKPRRVASRDPCYQPHKTDLISVTMVLNSSARFQHQCFNQFVLPSIRVALW